MATRTRDAERSREAILDAAERLFAAEGYEGTSLAGVGAAAGLSRATPGYFFGSKEDLYRAVIQRAWAARDAAIRPAFECLGGWSPREGATFEDVLRDAVASYVSFLAERPAFVALSEREGLDGGRRLRTTPHLSSAIDDSLRSLRRGARRKGLREFDVPSVLLCLVALSFFPVAHRRTFLPAAGMDPDSPRFVEERTAQVLSALLPMLRS